MQRLTVLKVLATLHWPQHFERILHSTQQFQLMLQLPSSRKPRRGHRLCQAGQRLTGLRVPDLMQHMGPGTLAAKPASYRMLCDLAPIPVIDSTRAFNSAELLEALTKKRYEYYYSGKILGELLTKIPSRVPSDKTLS